MNAPDWKKVRAILEHASELDRAAREAYLGTACAGDGALRAEIDALLAADTRAERLEPPSSSAVLHAFGSAQAAPKRIGPWSLEREIARGGMGTVWLAHRVDGGFSQRAAIKLIKRGMDSDEIVRRFERERAVLAALEHPGIARLYDGGTTDDGRPYLVMEFVDGVPLDTYCERASTSRDDCLRLFARVCDAVQHAHQHLIVHRDLKPANVLVTPDGTPKLLDFGIAKLLVADPAGAATRTTAENRVLTPQYASPEQMRGERVTTQSDVFSLGVILFELLTRHRPFDAKRSPDTEAIAPSRRSDKRDISADLDTIVLKALQLDVERRYVSVAALADDVRRFLSGEPVLARPDTWSYRANKFVRRNRLLVIATLTVIAALATGLVIARQQYVEAERARQVADRRLAGVLRLASSFSNKFNVRLAQIDGIVEEREGLLREMNTQLEELAEQAPDDRALAIELGWSRRELALVLGAPNSSSSGKFDEAAQIFDRALSDVEPLFAANPRHVETTNLCAALLIGRAALWHRAEQLDQARAALERVLAITRAAREGLPREREVGLLMRECDAYQNLMTLERDAQRRDVERARSLEYMQLAEYAHERHPDDSKFTYWLASALFARANSYDESGENELALADFERTNSMFEALAKTDPLNAIYPRALATNRYRMSGVLSSMQLGERAFEAAHGAWKQWEEVVKAEPNDVAAREKILSFAYTAGSCARQVSRLDVARAALERSIEALDEQMQRRPERRQLLMTKSTLASELGAVLAEAGDWRAAITMAEDAIQLGLQLTTDEERGNEWHYGMSISYTNLAECHVFAARDSAWSPGERREQIEAAQRVLTRAHELLSTARDRGELGQDEEQHLGYIGEVQSKALEVLESIPES